MGQTKTEAVASATLTVWGGDFAPGEITRGLGLRPNRAWQRGDTKSYRSPDGTIRHFDSKYEWSGWKRWLAEGHRRRSLEWQLGHWVKLLSPKAAVLRRLRARGLTVELNCCVISPSAVSRLPAELIAGLSSLGIDLEISWYAHVEGTVGRSNIRLQPAAADVLPGRRS